MEGRTLGLVVGILVLLGAATAIVQVLKRRTDTGMDPAILETFWRRVRAWWYFWTVLAAALLMGQWPTVVLFYLISFWALREFITLTPTRPGDHRTLFWVFFLWPLLQFGLVGLEFYGLYSILIPVYAFLFVPAGIALSGDSKRFLERSAKIQAGLLICVYCLSYAPALLTLPLPKAGNPTSLPLGGPPAEEAPAQEKQEKAGGEKIAQGQPAGEKPEGQKGSGSEGGEKPVAAAARPQRDRSANARLLFFFILLVQLSDALQYAWAQIPSKHVIAPTINPTKTWEGLLGGTASATLLGFAFWWATPFRHWWMAAGMSAVTSLMAFAGSLTMSAIKRDRGVKDYGTLVEVHGGVLDRLDSLCFAAPVFFHFTMYYLILTGAMDRIQWK
jgi:phosphatidate cytidylyltransferase